MTRWVVLAEKLLHWGVVLAIAGCAVTLVAAPAHADEGDAGARGAPSVTARSATGDDVYAALRDINLGLGAERLTLCDAVVRLDELAAGLSSGDPGGRAVAALRADLIRQARRAGATWRSEAVAEVARLLACSDADAVPADIEALRADLESRRAAVEAREDKLAAENDPEARAAVQRFTIDAGIGRVSGCAAVERAEAIATRFPGNTAARALARNVRANILSHAGRQLAQGRTAGDVAAAEALLACVPGDEELRGDEALGGVTADELRGRLAEKRARLESAEADEARCAASPACQAERLVAELCGNIEQRADLERELRERRAYAKRYGVVDVVALGRAAEAARSLDGRIAERQHEYRAVAGRPFVASVCRGGAGAGARQ